MIGLWRIGFAVGRIGFVAGCVLAASGATWAAPAYIKAAPAELSEAYGEDVAKRAFSDELTQTRTELINESVKLVPEGQCPEEPAFTLTDAYPYQGEPTDVIWIERYVVNCEQPLRRAMLMIVKEGNITAVPMAPGSTIADPNLQIDAANFAKTAALTQSENDCAEASIVDTALVAKPEQTGAPWKEQWSVSTCGETQLMDVLFTPSPEGGTNVAVTAASD